MSTNDSELVEYKNDPRIPCRYGNKCYQKNSVHHSKYKHPPKNNKRKYITKKEPAKKPKLDEGKPENVPTEQKEVQEESKQETTKRECISDSDSENESEDIQKPELESTPENILDPKSFIKEKFFITMPEDFYEFWNFCKELKEHNPCDALKDVGLKLVGAYDVLAGNFNNVKKSPEEYLRHWRYYYDPPEVQTVLKGDDKTGYHIGYFYDSPDEPPTFLVSNHATKDGRFTKMGDNIFAAVSIYLEELKKTGDPFKKMHIGKLLNSLKSNAEKLKLNLSSHSEKIKKRENKVVTRTSNKLGLVVPYNKKTQLGYRELAVSEKELMKLLDNLEKANSDQKSTYLSELQVVITNANIALDECDFGTGVKLGWELLYHGIDSLDSTICQFFSNSYRYLNKNAFVEIAKAHLANRKKGCNLSIL